MGRRIRLAAALLIALGALPATAQSALLEVVGQYKIRWS